jgi:hypothetical protein
MKRRIFALAATALLSIGLVGSIASEASAHSSTAVTTYPNGVRLTANVWGDNFADWYGCANFTSSAVITARPSWIKDVLNFHANGIGASISGVSIGGSGADASLSWTNSNGALGSYLSGRVCHNWLTWSLSATSTASALQYGTVRIASAGI